MGEYAAQEKIDDAVRVALLYGYTFERFVQQAQELWVEELRDEARRVRELRPTKMAGRR